MIPAKADSDKETAYLTQEVEPRFAEAEAGHRAAFIVNVAHVVLAPFLAFLFYLARISTHTPGRP